MVMRTRPGVQLVANLQGLNVWAWTPGRWVRSATRGFFSFLYLKKSKFQKYMAVSKNFKTIPLSPLAWATGGLSPSGWARGPKCKKNYI